jgi:hypothetical protein
VLSNLSDVSRPAPPSDAAIGVREIKMVLIAKEIDHV